jgi:ubiquinone/menaquinone biosynthesis C-methylase UbiE
MSRTAERQIQQNVRAHDAVAGDYERVHREIFNHGEQARLAAAVGRAVAAVRSARTPLRALDIGCGSGNVTRRLLDAGCHVTAADVSANFLQICRDKYAATGRLETVLLNGAGLHGIADRSFDIVTAYSVLHHVPDYAELVAEMARVAVTGGVVYIDHESSERVYANEPVYQEFASLAGKTRSPLKRVLTQTRRRRAIVHAVRSALRPGFETEGDIHVWPDDHIEFSRLREVLRANGCEVVEDTEYLLYPDGLDQAVYDRYANRCADMRLLIGRRTS